MEMLIEASNIQSMPPATQREGELGIIIRAQVAKIAPMKKKGLRLPQ